MAEVVQQFRQATDVAEAYVGPIGQIVIDTGFFGVRVHDGITPGGILTLAADNNLSEVDAAIARTNLGLGTAALLNADAGFMIGANDLSEVIDPAASRLNIGAAQRGVNNDITGFTDVTHAGISVLNPAKTFHTVVDLFSAITADRTLSIDISDANRAITLSGNLTVAANASVAGVNTGDHVIALAGDVAGPENATVIQPGVVTTGKLADVSVTTAKIVDHNITGVKLENIAAATGVFTSATVQIDAAGRVVNAASGPALIPFATKSISGAIPVTNGANFAHGMARSPDIVITQLVNAVAEFGFNPGDTIPITSDDGGSDAYTVVYNGGSVTFRYVGGVVVCDSGPGRRVITNANWTLRFICIIFN